jgi:hypothetical protein
MARIVFLPALTLSEPLRVLVGTVEIVTGLVQLKLSGLGSLCGFC